MGNKTKLNASVVGTWNLVDYFVTMPDGRERSWCEKPYGMLIYTADGHMSVAINCEGHAADDAPSKRFGDLLLYAGTYSLVSDTEVVHHIRNSSKVDQIGWDAKRTLQFDGSDLLLSGPPVKGLLGFRIRWRKFGER